MAKRKVLKDYKKLLITLHNGEHFEFNDAVIQRLDTLITGFGDDDLIDDWGNYKKLAAVEAILYKHSKSAEDTPTIVRLNGERLHILSFIYTTVKSYLNSPHEDERLKAERLHYIIGPYEDARNRNYPELTAYITNLIVDVKIEPAASFATYFSLTKSFDLLETTNKSFQTTYIQRAEAWAEKEKYGTLTQLRPLVDEAFETAMDTVNFLNEKNDRQYHYNDFLAVFTAIYDRLNAIITQFEHVLAQRGANIRVEKLDPIIEPPSFPTEPPLGSSEANKKAED